MRAYIQESWAEWHRQKIEDMRITIEDLEALKELNDELEENHVETEKALNEDLGLCRSSGWHPPY